MGLHAFVHRVMAPLLDVGYTHHQDTVVDLHALERHVIYAYLI